jgi:hypothetical protein
MSNQVENINQEYRKQYQQNLEYFEKTRILS